MNCGRHRLFYDTWCHFDRVCLTICCMWFEYRSSYFVGLLIFVAELAPVPSVNCILFLEFYERGRSFKRKWGVVVGMATNRLSPLA